MKTILTIITAFFLSAYASRAAVDGFFYKSPGPGSVYTVPAGKIVVIQQVSFLLTETAANRALILNSITVPIPNATNGLYTLTKPIFLPAGSTMSVTANAAVFGVIIDTADAPLFVGGGSSLGKLTFANNTVTGELQLSSTAASKVIIQSSTNLVDWNYDSTVVVQRGADKTKVRFTALVSGSDRYYRALVRRTNAG